MLTKKELRELINQYIQENNISIRKLSIEIKINYATFYRFLKGTRNLNTDNYINVHNFIDRKI